MRALPAVAILLVVAACQAPPSEMTDAEKAEVEQVIADQWAGFTETLLAVDYDGWVSYWTPDARVLQPGSDLSGSAWFDYVRDAFDEGMQWHTFDMESYEVFVHGDVAYEIGQYDETASLGAGEPVEWHDYFFVRWVKQEDGEWRISYLFAGPRDAPPEG